MIIFLFFFITHFALIYSNFSYILVGETTAPAASSASAASSGEKQQEKPFDPSVVTADSLPKEVQSATPPNAQANVAAGSTEASLISNVSPPQPDHADMIAGGYPI